MLSPTEENYLKCIYSLSEKSDKEISTNSISAHIQTTAASVTDMLRRLSEKGFLRYVKYKGARLTVEGESLAKSLVRRHRLWEVFLVNKLKFSWDEVHDIAEQLEHIHSSALIQRLDAFLGHPQFDPHGDPIPDQHGNYTKRNDKTLSEVNIGEECILVGVQEHSSEFLQYLDSLSVRLGQRLKVEHIEPYDNTCRIRLIPGGDTLSLSERVTSQLVVNVNPQ
ncbi:MAG: metal-dependent transcriptional regulator [Bacteroidota bacterium]|nr:metal-dependent transcriptional regulator [Bacteroidota bacterium]